MTATTIRRAMILGLLWFAAPRTVGAEEPWRVILPEQKRIEVRSPSQLPQVPTPALPPPATVANPQTEMAARYLSLDEAIRLGLANSEVVRVLTGVTASTSGRTIYDVAITNTRIDQERAAFDPQFRANNSWNRIESPAATFDPLDPSQAVIRGTRDDNQQFDLGLSKRNLAGGTSTLGVRTSGDRFQSGAFPLNPQNRSAVELGYTQPLLQGAGTQINRVPIVLARIDAERSYFQYKAGVQQLVQGVIEAYWTLVFARTDLWAREQQVEQAEFANALTQARLDVGDANAGDLAQTRLALENFRASLLASQANVLQRQAALLNILGFPPYEAERTVPVTPMVDQPTSINWAAINELGQRQRPDIIELKLILEADQQRLLLANNQARPQLNGVALYRWNGVEGEVPAGNRIETAPGQFTDWTLGVNFSVPLGLRRERALLRQQQLIIRRDRANLDQGLHQMQHLLALSIRNLDQFFAQYERYQAVRQAARVNLEQQLARYNEGIVQFIVVLQAIVDWGNSVSAEAQALSQYNTELARLELQTGTILESHGVVFYEERFASIGPLGRLGPEHCYPAATVPGENQDLYPASDQPSESYFNLEDPIERRDREESGDTERAKDLDEEVEFEEVEGVESGEMSDESIDALLPPDRSSRSLPSLLRRMLRR